MAIELLEESKAQEWGFKHPTDVRRTIDKSEIIHVLERHGENGTITQARQQPPVTKADIAQYPQYSDEADIKVLGRNDAGEVVISGKQINGHYVVVEQIRKGQNELAFKTMYFERGDLRKNPIFDSAVQEHPKHPSYELGLGRKSDTKMELDSTTSPLLADLSPQEMKQAVKKWDLTNPKPTDSLDFALVKDPELTELQEVFNTDKLIRQLRSAEVKDTLDKGFSLKEVLDYTSHLPTAQRNILGDE
ncbi:PBECR3 domain-containing polyvalent protein, partial [Helicobacter ailurogastricus]|uniref:PBECR3 domain-containing polyvalent protein n=1 Tax=Helicobacter ailurogastricus TaxID=1578720 RepID=UPI00403A262A